MVAFCSSCAGPTAPRDVAARIVAALPENQIIGEANPAVTCPCLNIKFPCDKIYFLILNCCVRMLCVIQ